MSGTSAAAKQEPSRNVRERAFTFAVRIVRLCKHLDQSPGTCRTLATQLLRAGTSIGANLEETQGGHTKRDFAFKNELALKEARETKYWLRLLAASEIVPGAQLTDLTREADELCRMIGAVIVTSKEKP